MHGAGTEDEVHLGDYLPLTLPKGADLNWRMVTEDHAGGKVIKGRFTLNETSASSYTYKFELQGDGGAYSVIEEGKATKSK